MLRPRAAILTKACPLYMRAPIFVLAVAGRSSLLRCMHSCALLPPLRPCLAEALTTCINAAALSRTVVLMPGLCAARAGRSLLTPTVRARPWHWFSHSPMCMPAGTVHCHRRTAVPRHTGSVCCLRAAGQGRPQAQDEPRHVRGRQRPQEQGARTGCMPWGSCEVRVPAGQLPGKGRGADGGARMRQGAE